jgi:hypothetical protein
VKPKEVSMPHHWKPFDAGNPDCETVVVELRARYGDGLKYVGFDGEKCWALYETPREEEQDEADVQPTNPCERRNLNDQYVPDRGPNQA